MSEDLSTYLEYAPWSHSKSDVAGKCPRSFKFKYIDKLERKEGSAAKVGTAAHAVQERILCGMPPEEALASVLAETPNLTSGEVKKVTGMLPSFIAFEDRMLRFKERFQVVETLLERKWAFNRKAEAVAFDAPDAIYRGVVDVAMVLENRTCVVFDHKSGMRRDITYFATQLDTYAVLALSQYPDLVSVQAGIHYMADRTVDWYVVHTADTIRKRLRPWLKNLLVTRAQGLREFDPRPSKRACQFCDYKHLCDVAYSAKKTED